MTKEEMQAELITKIQEHFKVIEGLLNHLDTVLPEHESRLRVQRKEKTVE